MTHSYSRLEETGGLEDDNPDFGPDPEPEPEDYCRARSGLCHPDGTCDKCGAIEGEHCKESCQKNHTNFGQQFRARG